MPFIITKEQSEIVLSATGEWFHRGEPFENIKIIEYFHRAIRRDQNGRYYLHNRYEGKEEHVYIEVEDVAYFVRRFGANATGHYQVTLNTGDEQELDLNTLEEDSRGVMYCRVLDNDRARFSDVALQQLADLAGMDDNGIYLELNGKKVYVSKG